MSIMKLAELGQRIFYMVLYHIDPVFHGLHPQLYFTHLCVHIG